MNSIKIMINKTPPSLNKMLGKYRYVLSALKKEWHQIVTHSIPKEHKGLNIRKCNIKVVMRFPDKRRRDYDNFVGGLKYIFDPLVFNKVLIDDSCDVIESFKVKIELGTLKSQTEIKIIYK